MESANLQAFHIAHIVVQSRRGEVEGYGGEHRLDVCSQGAKECGKVSRSRHGYFLSHHKP
jgi:hypothetical protein